MPLHISAVFLAALRPQAPGGRDALLVLTSNDRLALLTDLERPKMSHSILVFGNWNIF